MDIALHELAPGKARIDKHYYDGPVTWNSYIHPEGSVYRRADIKGLSFTTEAEFSTNATYSKLLSATKFIAKLLGPWLEDHKYPKDRIEVVLELAKDEDTEKDTWEYYIIDHNNQHILWLHSFNLRLEIINAQSSLQHVSESFQSVS